MRLMLILLVLLGLTGATNRLSLPLVKLEGQYYLKLTVAQRTGLMAVSFASRTAEAVAERINSGAGVSHAEVKTGKTLLGDLEFERSAKRYPDVDVIGTIGLAPNSTFIAMLEKHFNHPVALSFDLSHLALHVQKDSCESTMHPPFSIKIGTWTNFAVTTPLSFNFQPPADFLALMNSSKQPFVMNKSAYSGLQLGLEFEQRKSTILASSVLKCLKYEHKTDHECTVELGSDIGLLLFQFPIMVCSKGLKLAGRAPRAFDYDSMFFGLLIVFASTLLILLNWQSIRKQARQEKLYLQVPFMQESVQKLRLLQETLPG